MSSPLSAARILCGAFIVSLLLALVAAAPSQAAGSPDLQLSGGPATTVLYGSDIPVSLTAALPGGAPKGYNLAYRAVLPAGVSYVAGSAGTQDGEPRILTDAPTSGRTTLIWPNVDDLVANSSHTLAFSVAYTRSTATPGSRYDVGDQVTIDSGAYISLDPRDEADFTALGVPSPAGTDTYTGFAEQTTDTNLTAIKVVKSEPHPEGEIPRGVHDHQTVYTLTVTNNSVNPTNGVSLEDFLPAGLEFLGCSTTVDHTTDAPTNPGSTQEYPGSGPIAVAHPTPGEDCTQPDLVETISGDPDGAGPLAAGVYTHVKWNSIGSFPAGAVRQYTYGAAIPIRENTLDWNGAAAGTGTAPATTGAQTANLENNSGPETTDEQELTNGAVVRGTYVSPLKSVAVSDEGTLTRTAEDIAIQKSNDNSGLEQGDLTKWTIDLQVSEYRSVDDIVITDTVPDGLCPLSSTQNYENPVDQQTECGAVAGKDPSRPYTTVDEQADGTYVITWDKSTFGDLTHLKPSETRQLTFWTRTRADYQENFVKSTPVLSKDAVSNKIDVTGNDWVRCVDAPNDCTTSGTKIDHDETDGDPDIDKSGSGKAASGPVIEKTVGKAFPGPGQCDDLVAADYGKTVPAYGPGDHVCWKLRLVFPAKLDTTSQDVFDVLPTGLTYVAGSWQATSANTLAIGAVDTSDPGRLRWPIGMSSDVDSGGQVFELTFESTVGSPLGHHSGDVEGNLQKFSYENTPGTAFTLRDRTDFTLQLPELSLVKGVREINGNGTVFPPDTDHKQVRAGDAVQYRVDVTNGGTADAAATRVWDLLPTGITCTDLVPGSISDGGVCVPGSFPTPSRIEWNGTSAIIPNDKIAIPAGATRTLTYTVSVPSGVSPDQTFVNTAGVVEFSYTTNVGTTYQLIPDNPLVKDATLPAPNTFPAQDDSDVYTPASAIAKTRTTTVTEGGNATGQAAIGETVTYTVTTTIPAGTTLYAPATVTDPLGARQTYVPGSLSGTLNGVDLATAGVTAGEAGNTISATLPTPYVNGAGDDVLVLTFQAKVLDVDANVRGASLGNTATLSFKDQLDRTVTHAGSVSTTIVEPKIALAKAHSPAGRVSPGDTIVYTVTASNGSGTNVSTAHDVRVVDTVPTGEIPVDGAGDPVADGAAVPPQGGIWNAGARTITWTTGTTPALATLAPGASTGLTYRVRLDNPVSGASYDNVADATTTSLDGSLVVGVRSSTATASTAGDYKAHVAHTLTLVTPTVTKDVTPANVTIGDKVTWTVHVTLPKLLKYFDTTIADTVPDGVDVDGYGTATCVSGCPGGDPAIQPIAPVTALTAGRLRAAWFLGDLEASAADRKYDLVLTGHVRDTYRNGGAKVLDAQTLTNTVDVRTNRTDKLPSSIAAVAPAYDDTSTPATAVNTVVEPKLAIDKSVDHGTNVQGGEHLTYTIAVKNNGTSPAYDVVVADQPDTELTNVTLAAGLSTTASTDGWTAGDPDMRWTIPGPIAAGATVTLTYSADVKPGAQLVSGAPIDNTASIVESYGVPQATRTADGFVYRRYEGPDDTVHLVARTPNLTIVKTPDNGAAIAGTASSFTIVVRTTDSYATAHNVSVTDQLPPGLTYTAGQATSSPATGFSETSVAGSPQLITWAISSLAPGATRTITLPVQVAADVPNGTPLTNTARTHADEVPTDKTDTGSLLVSTRADLQVTKTSTPSGDVVPGTQFDYTIVTRNNGPSDAKASKMVDTLPSYLTFVSLDDPANCAAAGQTVTCDYGTLVPGATRTVTVRVLLDPARTTAISNTATVTTTTTDPVPGNDSSTKANPVKPTAAISIRKTADKASYLGGDTITWTLVATNDGPSTAAGVTVDDDIPSEVTPVSVSPGAPPTVCDPIAVHVHCDLGSLAPGTSRTITVTGTVKGTAPATSSTETHKITVSKEEQYVSLQPGETRTIDVSCGAGGTAADGVLQVVSVDQGQDPAGVVVRQASSIATGTYRFVVTNTTGGQAQVRPHVVCLPATTDDGAHPLVVSAPVTQTTGTLTPGRHSFVLPVGSGVHAIAQGFEVLSGVARLVASEPQAGGGWRFTVDVQQDAKVTFSLRTLRDTTGAGGSPAHVHPFAFQHVERSVTIGPGRTNQVRLECPVGYKGIVGTYDLPAGVYLLGSVPEPINRDVDLLNTTGAPVTVLLDLECLAIETGPPLGETLTITNTATVASPTFDPDTSDNSSTVVSDVARAVGLKVTPPPAKSDPAATTPPATTGPAAATRLRFGTPVVTAGAGSATVPVTCTATATCRGTVTVAATVPVAAAPRAGSAAKAKGRRVVLGRASYVVKPGRTVKVKVAIAARYRSLLRSGKVRSVTIVSGAATSTKKVVLAKAKQTAKRRL